MSVPLRKKDPTNILEELFTYETHHIVKTSENLEKRKSLEYRTKCNLLPRKKSQNLARFQFLVQFASPLTNKGCTLL